MSTKKVSYRYRSDYEGVVPSLPGGDSCVFSCLRRFFLDRPLPWTLRRVRLRWRLWLGVIRGPRAVVAHGMAASVVAGTGGRCAAMEPLARRAAARCGGRSRSVFFSRPVGIMGQDRRRSSIERRHQSGVPTTIRVSFCAGITRRPLSASARTGSARCSATRSMATALITAAAALIGSCIAETGAVMICGGALLTADS